MRAMNYKKIYESIVSRGKARVIKGYKERHHIIPRCMGGGDEEDNLVNLTPEEHYVCHQLLVKMYPTNIKLLYAAHACSKLHSKNHPESRKINNKKYGWLRRRHSKLQRTGAIIKCKCGKEFYAANYRKNRYSHLYCSKECRVKYRVYRSPEKVNIPCIQCNKIMIMSFKFYDYTKKKFCSQSCRSTYNNTAKKTGRYRLRVLENG
jgi:hypothetical protein